MEHAYDEFNIEIGKRIKKLRLQRKYTREYLSECADIWLRKHWGTLP